MADVGEEKLAAAEAKEGGRLSAPHRLDHCWIACPRL